MGMGTFAITAITIEPVKVQEICPKEYAEFEAAEAEYKGNLFSDTSFGEIEDDRALQAVTALSRAFHDRTGLHLQLGYIDPDTAERYDDFTGEYFEIDYDDVFIKSPNALKFEEEFDMRLSIQYSTCWG